MRDGLRVLGFATKRHFAQRADELSDAVAKDRLIVHHEKALRCGRGTWSDGIGGHWLGIFGSFSTVSEVRRRMSASEREKLDTLTRGAACDC